MAISGHGDSGTGITKTGSESKGEGVQTISLDGQPMVDIPGDDFIANAEITRDGQDLVLEGADGTVIVIEGYFNAVPAPMLVGADGATLTPGLVSSFISHGDHVQFADAGAGSLNDESAIGVIKELSGHATVTHPDGTVETIALGTAIYEGDIVETAADGAVNIMFVDESSFAISDNARLAIDEYVFDPGTQSGTTNVSMLRGLFVYTSGLIGREDPDDVEIDTPVGSIGIRGTVIAGNIDTGEITVMEGAIVLRDFNGNEMTLANQFQTAQFNPLGGNILASDPMTPADFDANYGNIKMVAPDLFTGFDDGGADGNGDGAAGNGDGADASGGDGADASGGEQQDGAAQGDGETGGDGQTDPAGGDTYVAPDDLDAGFDDPSGEGTFDTGDTLDGTGQDTVLGGSTGTGGSTGDTGSSGSTASGSTGGENIPPAPPPQLPDELIINRHFMDDDGGFVAVVGSSTGVTGLSFSLVGAQVNGVPASGFAIQTSPQGDFATITYSGPALDPNGDIVQLAVQATAPNGESRVDGFGVVVDDLMHIQNIGALDSDTGTTNLVFSEENAGNVADMNAFIQNDENPSGQNVTWTLVSANSENSMDVSGNFYIDSAYGNANQAQLQLNTGLDADTIGSYVDVVVKGAVIDETSELVEFTKTLRVQIDDINDVAPVLDVSTGVQSSDGLQEGGYITLTTAMLHADDSDTPDSGVVYNNFALTNGYIADAGDTGTPITSFTQAELASGNIVYVHDGSQTTTDTFNFDLFDGVSTTAGQSVGIAINAVNNAPTLDLDGDDSSGAAANDVNVAFTEGTPVFVTDDGVTNDPLVTDPEDQIQSATITLTNAQDGALETLFHASGNVTIGNITISGSGTDTITLSGADTAANYQAIIQAIQYDNLSDVPDPTIRTVDVQLFDGTSYSNTATSYISVTPVDDNDTFSGSGTVYGDAGDDTISGSAGGDIIHGAGGNDTLSDNSDAAGDIFWGEDGDDTHVVYAGDGSDSFYGGNTGETNGDTYDASGLTIGEDMGITFGATAGNASATQGSDTDTMTGVENFITGGGNDTFNLTAANGFYSLDGGAGSNTLNYSALSSGNSLDFTFSAGSVDVDINAGSAAHTANNFQSFTGSQGDDIFHALDGDGGVSLDGDGGNDKYDGSALGGMTVTLSAVAGTVAATDNDSVSNIEWFVGGAATDVFNVDGIFGGYQFDGGGSTTDEYRISTILSGTVFNLDGPNTVTVSNGGNIDTLQGIENLFGGSGDETFSVHDVNAVYAVDGGAGTDTLDFDDVNIAPVTIDFANMQAINFGAGTIDFNGIETIIGKSGAAIDQLDFSGALAAAQVDLSANQVIDDGAGNGFTVQNFEEVVGSNYDDELRGGAANESIWGGLGNDTLAGGAGADQLDGESGIDTVDYSQSGAAVSVDLGAGSASGGDATGDTLFNIENLTGSAYNDTLRGDNSINVLSGGLGDDTLRGSGGADTMDGGAGTDTADYSIFGFANNITSLVLNSAGSTSLTSAGGNDILNGIENVIGTQGADTIDGSTDAASNTIDGFDGADTLIGGTGDMLLGGGGNDFLRITSDNIDLDGGAGTDAVQIFSNGSFNANNFLSFNSVEEIRLADAQGTSATLDLDVTGSLFTNDTPNLFTIRLDGTDTLNLDFTTYGGGGNFVLTSDSGTIRTYDNSTTGDQLVIHYGAGAVMNVTGDLPTGDLYLNDPNFTTNGDGFRITDNNGEGFGYGITLLGDINADGLSDLAFTKFSNPDGFDARTFVLNGGTALTDTTVGGLGINNNDFGSAAGTTNLVISGGGDFNGDGVADYIVGTADANNIQIVDSAGTVLADLAGLSGGELAGQSVSFIGDVDGDGMDDVLIGASGDGVANEGAAYLLFGDDVNPVTSFDVNTLGTPIREYSTPLGNTVKDMDASHTVAGPTAFVLMNDNTVEMYDMDNAGGPVLISPTITDAIVTGLAGYPADGSNPMINGVSDIMVEGPYMYILTGDNTNSSGQITVLDVSTPTSPTLVDTFDHADLFNATAMDMTEDGKLVAISSDGAFLWMDVSPGADILGIHGTTPLTFEVQLAGATDVTVMGNYAYVVTPYDSDGAGSFNSTVQVVDMTGSDPVLGSYVDFTGANAVYLDPKDGMLYVTTSGGDLTVFDLADPTLSSPLPGTNMWTFSHAELSGATDLVVDDGIAYITTSGGVVAVDVHDTANIQLTDGVDGFGHLDVGTNDDFAVASVIGDDGELYFASNNSNTLLNYDLKPEGFNISGGANDLAGVNVASAGDFNDDGFDDFLISMPGSDRVALAFGGEDGLMGLDLTNTTTYMEIANVADSDDEIPVFSMGDLDGDGISDVAVVADGVNGLGGDGEIYIFYGDPLATPGTSKDASTGDNLTIAAASGFEIIGGGAVGDFDGDGFDDALVAMRDTSGAGDMVSLYLIYGGTGVSTLDNSTVGQGLNDSTNAFVMTYQIPNGGGNNPASFDIEVSSAGDINGDGFADLVLGMPNLDSNLDGTQDGESIVVYGRDVFGITHGGTATMSADFLVGGNGIDTLDDGGYDLVSFRAGAGDDTIRVGDANADGFADDFFDIDGGGGFDTLQFVGGADSALDFTNVGSESYSNVEHIDMATSTSSEAVVLGMDDIFDMLQSSPDAHAKISGDTNDIFAIEMPDFGHGTGILMDNNWSIVDDGEGFLHDFGIRTAQAGGYSSFTVDSGGYDLWISDALLDSGHVVIGNNIVLDDSPDDANGSGVYITASDMEQTLVGNNTSTVFNDGGQIDTSMFGFDNTDTFQITNGNFDMISGGAAHDVIEDQFGADLRSFNAHDISGIEEVQMNTSANLTLSVQNLVDMAKSSDGGSYLLIDGFSTTGRLVLDVNGSGSGTISTAANLASAMGGDWTHQLSTTDANCLNSNVEYLNSATLGVTIAIDSNLFTNGIDTI